MKVARAFRKAVTASQEALVERVRVHCLNGLPPLAYPTGVHVQEITAGIIAHTAGALI